MSAGLDVFYASLRGDSPPRRLPPPLAGVWLGMKGRCGEAHEVVQDEPDADAALVQAWLCRVEGDEAAALLWYRFAGAAPAHDDCEIEGRRLARKLIDG